MSILQKTFSFLLLALVFVGGFFVSMKPEQETKNTHIAFQMQLGMQQVHADPVGSTNPAIAATTDSKTDGNKGDSNKTTDSINKGLNTFAGFFNVILGVITVLVTPFIMFAGWLLSPDWVSGRIFGLQAPMYTMWTTIANIVYFIYAVMLIVVAIATIFNSQNYWYKQLLPRLFVGIILVPFTWWFVQFIISIATFTTSAVLEIPYETIKKIEGTKQSFWKDKVIPSEMTMDTYFTSFQKMAEECKEGKNPKGDCISPESLVSGAGGVYSPLLVYSYGIFKLHSLKTINTDGIDVVTNVGSLVSGMLISSILFFAFGLIVIALIAVLFIRVLMMWMYAMFSPLFTFKYVFPDKVKVDNFELFEIPEFIATAFVPAIVGLILAFGLIVSSAVKTGMQASFTADTKLQCDKETLISPQGCKIATIMGNPKNTIVMNLKNSEDAGLISNDGKDTVTGESLQTVTTVTFGTSDSNTSLKLRFPGSIEKGQSVKDNDGNLLGRFATIIVQFIAIMFIWVAFTAIGKTSKLAGKIISPIADFGKNMAYGGIKSVPLPGGLSIGALSKVPDQIRAMEYEKQGNYKEQLASSGLWKVMGMTPSVKADNPAINNSIQNTTTSIKVINWRMDDKAADWKRVDVDWSKFATSMHEVYNQASTSNDIIAGITGSVKWLMDQSKDKDNKFNAAIFNEWLVKSRWSATKFGTKISEAIRSNGWNPLTEDQMIKILSDLKMNKDDSLDALKKTFNEDVVTVMNNADNLPKASEKVDMNNLTRYMNTK